MCGGVISPPLVVNPSFCVGARVSGVVNPSFCVGAPVGCRQPLLFRVVKHPALVKPSSYEEGWGS